MVTALALIWLSVVGCLAGGCAPETSLVDMEAWTLVSAADDPFADRPADARCDPIGYRVEEFGGEVGLAVETGPCPYLTAEQPSRAAVRAGETVQVRWLHDELTAPDPGEAHVAVTLDSEMIFEDRVTIPASEDALAGTWTAPEDIAAGAPVLVHVHNHGANTWALLEVGLVD